MSANYILTPLFLHNLHFIALSDTTPCFLRQKSYMFVKSDTFTTHNLTRLIKYTKQPYLLFSLNLRVEVQCICILCEIYDTRRLGLLGMGIAKDGAGTMMKSIWIVWKNMYPLLTSFNCCYSTLACAVCMVWFRVVYPWIVLLRIVLINIIVTLTQ
jgi:hypothetical protein